MGALGVGGGVRLLEVCLGDAFVYGTAGSLTASRLIHGFLLSTHQFFGGLILEC